MVASPESGQEQPKRETEIEVRTVCADKAQYESIITTVKKTSEVIRPTCTIVDERYEIPALPDTTVRIRGYCTNGVCKYEWTIKTKNKGIVADDAAPAKVRSEDVSEQFDTKEQALQALSARIKELTQQELSAEEILAKKSFSCTRERTVYRVNNEECGGLVVSADVFTSWDGVEYDPPLYSLEFEVTVPEDATDEQIAKARQRVNECAEKLGAEGVTDKSVVKILRSETARRTGA
ncbi:MAG: hypothetical protein NBV63_00615 [Candidatus Pacebacteria bacterium]|nr:hypothetical protein [Candidatus Paceibacterota bacterium]